MRILATKFALVLLLTVFATDSNAQFMGGSGSTWNNPVSAMISQKMWNDINGKMMLLPALRKMGCTQAQINKMNLSRAQIAIAKKTCTPGGETASPEQTGGGRATNSKQPATQPAGVYSTTFRPTGTRIAMPQIVVQITPNDRVLQQRQTAFLEAAISSYEKQQRPRGYGDDVAAAMAFFASVAIHLQDTTMPVNQKGIDSLTDALRATFGDKLANMSDRDKQEAYETLLTFGLFISGRGENADATTRGELKQLSASLCDQYLKLDVTKYRFNDDGLIEIGTTKNVPTQKDDRSSAGSPFRLKLYDGFDFPNKRVVAYGSDPGLVDVRFYQQTRRTAVFAYLGAEKIREFDSPPTGLSSAQIDGWERYSFSPKSGAYYVIRARNGRHYLLHLQKFENQAKAQSYWQMTFDWKEMQVR